MTKNETISKFVKNKLVKALVVFSIGATGLGLAACNRTTPTPTPTPTPPSPIVKPVEPPVTPTTVKVATPVLTKNGTIYTFTRDENAERYVVEFGDTRLELENDSFDSKTMYTWTNSFSIYGVAKNDTETTVYEDSDKASENVSLSDFLTEEQLDAFGMEKIDKVEYVKRLGNNRIIVSGTYVNTNDNVNKSRIAYADFNNSQTYGDVSTNFDVTKIVKYSGDNLPSKTCEGYAKLLLKKYQSSSTNNTIKAFVGTGEFEVVEGSMTGNYSMSFVSKQTNIKCFGLIKNSDGETAHVLLRSTVNVKYSDFNPEDVTSETYFNTVVSKTYDGSIIENVSSLIELETPTATASASAEGIAEVDKNNNKGTTVESESIGDFSKLQYFPYTYSDGTELNNDPSL